MPPIRRNRRNGRNPNQQTISVSCTTILDLNEHCLLDVFRLLSPLDMCSVFDTCQRFREIARTHMTSFYRSNELILGDQATNGIKMLCKFGSAVTKLRMELWHYQYRKAAFSWFRKLNPKLDSLTLSVKDFNAAPTLRPMLGNLRIFRIEYVKNDFSWDSRCDIHREDIIKDLLKACSNVEEFSFGAQSGDMQGQYQGIFLQLKFRRIHLLEIYKACNFDINNLKIFLKLNQSVQRISIKLCVSLNQLAAFNLSQYAPNLEAVALQFIDGYEPYFKPFNLRIAIMLSQLEKLKYLALDTCYKDIKNFIASLAKRNTLIYLSLTHVVHVNNEGLGAAFTNMTNLRVLRLHIIDDFHAFHGSEFFTQMCKNLVSLEELHLYNAYITTKQIGDIIENSVNLKKLYFPNQFAQVEDGVLNEDAYGDFVRMQSRKNVPFPLTFFFENDCFCVVMVFLRSALNQDVINVSKFDLADFDPYTIPHSIL